MEEKHTERALRLEENADRFGILRYVLAYLDWDLGLQPHEVLADLIADLEGTPDPWPRLGPLAHDSTELLFLYELHRSEDDWEAFHLEFAVWAWRRYGLAESSAWRAVLQAQSEVMPAKGRALPRTLELEHDVTAWYIARLRHGQKACGLDQYDHGTMVVRDPQGLCAASRPHALAGPTGFELESGLSEAHQHHRSQGQGQQSAIARSA